MRETPVDTGDSRPRVSVVDAWLSPMSTTVRDRTRSATSTPPVCSKLPPKPNKPNDGRVPQAPTRRPLGRPPPRHPATGTETPADPPCSRMSHSAARAPRPWPPSPPNPSRSPGHVPVGRGAADRRRPRPPPPAPPSLETRRRLEVPAWQARRVARQTHRLTKAAAICVDEQVADRGTCGPVIVDRLAPTPSPPTTPRNTKTGRTPPRPAGTSPSPTPSPPTSSAPPTSKPPATPWCSKGSTRWSARIAHQPFLTATPTLSACARSKPSASSPANPRRPAKPGPRISPASAADTTAPRPPVAGDTSARPTATNTGTARTARPTSSPRADITPRHRSDNLPLQVVTNGSSAPGQGSETDLDSREGARGVLCHGERTDRLADQVARGSAAPTGSTCQ